MIATAIVIYLTFTIATTFWALTDITFKRRLNHSELWGLLIFIFPVIGTLIYFQTRERKMFDPKFKR